MKRHCWKRLSNTLQGMELLNKKQISRVDNDDLFAFFRMHFNLQTLVYNLQPGPQCLFQPYFSLSPVHFELLFLFFLGTAKLVAIGVVYYFHFKQGISKCLQGLQHLKGWGGKRLYASHFLILYPFIWEITQPLQKQPILSTRSN